MSAATPLTDTWAAIEVGCAACQENTKIIGVYKDVDAAITAADEAYEAHEDKGRGTCSQYTTEVHRLPEPV
jgi:hypothetical protein